MRQGRDVVSVLTLAVAVAIGLLTLLPTGGLERHVMGSDKAHHLIAFAALILPAATAAPRVLWRLWPLALLYGGAIELIQPWVGRDGDIRDALADGLGLCLGTALGLFLHWLRSRAAARDPAA